MSAERERDALLAELSALDHRMAEDMVYEEVLREIADKEFDAIAKARALVEAEGDQAKADALYLKHRVRRLMDLAREDQIALVLQAQKSSAQELKAARQEQIHEQRATEKLKLARSLDAGRVPIGIKWRYGSEFAAFVEEWVHKEHARKFVPQVEVWRLFLENKGLL